MKPTLNAADIELLKEYFATKEDITEIRQKMATKQDLADLKANTVRHDQLRQLLQETKQEIIDEIATVVAKNVLPVQEDHERRITQLEAHSNLPTSK